MLLSRQIWLPLLCVVMSVPTLTQAQTTTFSLPLTVGSDNKQSAGAFAGGVQLRITMSGSGDVVDPRFQTYADGSLVVPCTYPGYAFANEGASGYPVVGGGDGVNHFHGGGLNYNPGYLGYGFAGATTTDTTNPDAIRHGAVVGTFSTTPSRSDWFYIGLGATVTVPAGGATLYVAVNEVFNSDNHGAYSGSISVVSASSAVVSGTVTLGDCPDPEQNITFEFRPKPSGTPFKVKQVLTQSGPNSGGFSIAGIPAGTYDIAIKGFCWLQKVIPNVVVSGNVSNLHVTLTTADLNDDNMVDIADFGLLVNEYSSVGDP